MITPADVELVREVMRLDDQEPSPARDARLAEAAARAEAEDLPHAAMCVQASLARGAMQGPDLDTLARATAALDRTWVERGADLEPIIRRHVTMAYWNLLYVGLWSPRVSLDRLEMVLEVFATWCRRFGWNQRETHCFAFRIAALRGAGADGADGTDEAAVDRQLRAWRSTPADPDLPLVEQGHYAMAWLTRRGRAAEALSLYADAMSGADPHLELTSEAEVSLRAAALSALLTLGRDKEAAAMHEAGLNVHGAGPTMESVGPHLLWCAHTAAWDRGVALLRPYAVLLEPAGRGGLSDTRWLLDGARHAQLFLEAATAAGRRADLLPLLTEESLAELSPEDQREVAAMARPLDRAAIEWAALADELAATFERLTGGDDDRRDLAAFRSFWAPLVAPRRAGEQP